jgi:threonine dehydrogenase-like Zn-dependent dehydrogenase
VNCARSGGKIGFVGVPHGVTFDGQYLFRQQKSLLGGAAPVRRYLPYLMDMVLNREINPGKVFDLEVPLLCSWGSVRHAQTVVSIVASVRQPQVSR